MSDDQLISPGPAAEDLVFDVTTATFKADVIDASREVTVLVDFWAPWCGPCRQLGPAIEKVVKAAKGAVKLAKMNIDEHPEVAGQLGVQSIPAVFAFKDGQPVDGFMGALPESQIKAFVERVAGPDALGAGDAQLEMAEQALEAGDLQSAVALFSGLLSEDQENATAIAGLAQCYIRSGDLDQAEQTLALVPPKKQNETAVAAAAAELALARQTSELGTVADLRKAVKKSPHDNQARFDLALALNAQGEREEALEELITIMRRDREWNDDGARKQLVQFFDAWGPSDPSTVKGRRQLSAILFA